jgi:predicted RNA-binding protein with PUA-like domain
MSGYLLKFATKISGLMNYWLVKSEPSVYGWDQLTKDKRTGWEGVRNYAARNNLREMRKGDLVLYYHSMEELRIVGIARVVKEHYQDPTTAEAAWLSVDLAPEKAFPRPVTLAEIKAEPALKQMELVRISRLSVSKVTEKEFRKVCEMGGIKQK